MKPSAFQLEQPEWDAIRPLLPPPKIHPCGAHNPRISDRIAMEAIVAVFLGGHGWAPVARAKGVSASSVRRRFIEWLQAGVFDRLAVLELAPPVTLAARAALSAPRHSGAAGFAPRHTSSAAPARPAR